MSISNKRFKTLFLNWWETTEKVMTLSEMESICKDLGMTRAEFIELVSRSDEFISKNGWMPEFKVNEKVNTEEEENEKISEPTNKSTPVPDYFRFIEMLERANVSFTKILTENIIEIKDGYDAIDFIFDEETLKLKEISF